MIKGFGLSGFRSFGPGVQRLYPLEKVNLVVGRNNAGKSNLLRAVQLLEQFTNESKKFRPPSGLDAHIGKRASTFRWVFPLEIDEASVQRLTERLFSDPNLRRNWSHLITEILSALPGAEAGTAWITYQYSDDWRPVLPDPVQLLTALQGKSRGRDLRGDWYRLWSSLTNHSGGSFEQHHGPGVLAKLVSEVIPRTGPVSQLREALINTV
jgi:hypothetical protein